MNATFLGRDGVFFPPVSSDRSEKRAAWSMCFFFFLRNSLRKKRSLEFTSERPLTLKHPASELFALLEVENGNKKGGKRWRDKQRGVGDMLIATWGVEGQQDA